MKKALLFVIGALLVAAPAYAGFPYVACFGDFLGGPSGADHSGYSVYINSAPVDVEMWIWWLPAPGKGLSGIEFSVVYPPQRIMTEGAVTTNPLIASEQGTLTTGMIATVSPTDCQYDWFWSHHQVLTAFSAGSYCVNLRPNPGRVTPPFDIILTSCEPGFPTYACTKLCDFWINYKDAVKPSTWGSIKSLYE